jgi:lipopolysaccharide export LptBFGC system permease protein LptF
VILFLYVARKVLGATLLSLAGVVGVFLAVVAHYLLLRGGEVLALRNALPAPIALQIPTVGLALVALVLIANQARRGVGAVR